MLKSYKVKRKGQEDDAPQPKRHLYRTLDELEGAVRTRKRVRASQRPKKSITRDFILGPIQKFNRMLEKSAGQLPNNNDIDKMMWGSGRK